MLRPSLFPTVELSSIKAALDPLPMIHVALIDRLGIRLTIDQTAHEDDRPTECDEHTFHLSPFERPYHLIALGHP